MSRTDLATVRSSLVFEFADRALGARLFLNVGLIARFAVAATVGEVPLAVSLAEEGGLLDNHRVIHASADRLLDERHFATRRRRREVREVHGNLRTADVVNFDGQDGDASTLIAEREVHALLRHRDRLYLRVYHHPGISVEPSLARGDASCWSNSQPFVTRLRQRESRTSGRRREITKTLVNVARLALSNRGSEDS